MEVYLQYLSYTREKHEDQLKQGDAAAVKSVEDGKPPGLTTALERVLSLTMYDFVECTRVWAECIQFHSSLISYKFPGAVDKLRTFYQVPVN